MTIAKEYLVADNGSPESIETPVGQVVAFSRRCPNKDSPNEDAALVCQTGDLLVLAVADGMGGAAAGEQASRLAVKALRREIETATGADALRGPILNAIESANREILNLGVGAATTLAAVEITREGVRPYHIGDSAALIVGQRGKVKLHTVAHSPVGQAVDAGVIDEEEAMHHEDRHIVSNALGFAEMRIEIGSTLALAERDTVLLATDGLMDNLSVDEVVGYIRKGPLETAVKNLVEVATERMAGAGPESPSKPDDLTVVAYRPARRAD